LKNWDIATKSLVAAKPIKKGELFTEENVAIKRPGSGISPMAYWWLLNRSASKEYEQDELIDE
jgi:N-acetylneuraminate synthase